MYKYLKSSPLYFKHLFILLTFLNFNTHIIAQYCTPEHENQFLEKIIDDVILGDISNINSGYPETETGYSDYTSYNTNLSTGSSYTVIVGTGDFAIYNISVWIDYNQNYEFEPAEELGTYYVYSDDETTQEFNFTVPDTAMSGETRMRVRAIIEPWGLWLLSRDPCVPFAWGECEDYTVTISDGINNNVAVTEVYGPISAVDLATENISINILNNGETDASDFNINYSFDGGTSISETFTGVLESNSEMLFTFSSPITFVDTGCHLLEVWINWDSDEIVSDNNISTNICNLDFVYGPNIWYLYSNIDGGSEPGGYTSNTEAMNTVFTDGGWTQEFFETADVNSVFSKTSCVVYLDGSINHIDALEEFIKGNKQKIENWVAAGGNLFINSSAYTFISGGAIVNNLGFNNIKMVQGYPIAYVEHFDESHPISVGPFTPLATEYSGFYHSNSILYGNDLHIILADNDDEHFLGPEVNMPVLAEKEWGIGKLIFGSLNPSEVIYTEDEAMNIKLNILSYINECSESPDVYDAGITLLNHPSSGCGLSSEEKVEIMIHNYGTSILTDIPVAFTLNDGSEILETAEISLEPGGEYLYTFDTPIDLIESGEYIVEVYSKYGLDYQTYNDTLTSTIISLATPIDVLPENISVCSSYTIDAGNTGSIFLWNTGDTSQAIETHISGDFIVEITDSGSGCGLIDTISVNINNTPEAGFTYLVEGTSVVFNNTTINSGTYSWDFGDGSTSGIENPTHTYSENGIYTIVLTAANECGTSTFSEDIFINSVLIDEQVTFSFHIYPNPASDNLFIKLQCKEDRSYKYKIINILDEILINNSKYISGYSMIDVSLLNDGIYYIVIETEGVFFTKEFIVSKN